MLYPLARNIEYFLAQLNERNNSPGILISSLTLEDIRRLTLGYIQSLRLARRGRFQGYLHSLSTSRPVLYATLAALLTKHLYNAVDEQAEEELAYISRFQGEDGLFRDAVIACETAETEDWWGWRHLTLHALMTLALYGKPAPRKIRYLENFYHHDKFRRYLATRDWAEKAAWTSNEIQNLGVMLQYSRDFQNSDQAADLLEILYEAIEAHQDQQTGLHGRSFNSPEELSLGVQAGYHFWLLYFYDRRPIPYSQRIVDSLLQTQNPLGGYGVSWHSSACEDIDTIDPLVRFSLWSDYRRADIQQSLQRALPAVLGNLNGDGGWVFRRHQDLKLVHRQMYSAANESNIFYTWFRTLGLAYCLTGLATVPEYLEFHWNFGCAPGYQFFEKTL